jgi:hypothetical protein
MKRPGVTSVLFTTSNRNARNGSSSGIANSQLAVVNVAVPNTAGVEPADGELAADGVCPHGVGTTARRKRPTANFMPTPPPKNEQRSCGAAGRRCRLRVKPRLDDGSQSKPASGYSPLKLRVP